MLQQTHLIFDTNSIAAKAFFATHYNVPKFDSTMFRSAFLKSFLRILTDLADFGQTITLCVDSKCWRKDIYPDYKANRKDLKEKVNYKDYINDFEDILAEMKMVLPVNIVKRAGMEADDLLAWYANDLTPKVLVSGDKDIVQLINIPRVQLYNPFKNDGEMVINNDLKLFLHTLICTGDASDNIPSVITKGINPKGKLWAKMPFGEKTIKDAYAIDCESNISKSFLDNKIKTSKDKLKKGKIGEDFTFTEADIKILHERYISNKKLIDLALSPVHNLQLPLPGSTTIYNEDAIVEFFNRYIPDHFNRHQQRLLTLLRNFN